MGEVDGSTEEDEVKAIRCQESSRQGGRPRSSRSRKGRGAAREGDDGTCRVDKAADGPRFLVETQVVDIEPQVAVAPQVIRRIDSTDQGRSGDEVDYKAEGRIGEEVDYKAEGRIGEEVDYKAEGRIGDEGSVNSQVGLGDEGHSSIHDTCEVFDREVG
jgi:hypothetical protein